MGVVNTKERERGRDDVGEGADYLSNTINELQILQGHKDIARLLVVLDHSRIASGSDDGTVIVWNYMTGEQLSTLTGHSRPITCLLLLDPHTLISGSSDRTIRIWSIGKGECEHVIDNAHSGSVQCLAKLEVSETKGALFCSGGNDTQLKIWRYSASAGSAPTLVGTLARQDEENLHCLLPISGNRIVTGSNSSFLFVYDWLALKFDKLLAYHRESVRCLVPVSDILFASGSLDGSIVVWQADTLAPLKVLDYPEKYFENHVFTSSINHITVLSERYLGAAVGRGFKVFDISSGDCVADCKDAHEANITRIASMYKGTRIVSCSADSSIKLWGAQLGSSVQKNAPSRYAFGRLRASPTQPICLGDMWGHSDAVNDMVALSDSSLCTCGADGQVILWKDGREQSEIRNQTAKISLMQHLLLEAAEDEEDSIGIDLSPRSERNGHPHRSRSSSEQRPRSRKSSLSRKLEDSPQLDSSREHRTKRGSPLKGDIHDRIDSSLTPSFSFDTTGRKESLDTSPGRTDNVRMTVSDGQVLLQDGEKKRRNTLRYRGELDLEMEACATLQQSGSEFSVRQLSDKSTSNLCS